MSTKPRPSPAPLPPGLAIMYRWTSALWLMLACAMGCYAYGSTLLRDAVILRLVLPGLAALVAVAMLVRLVAPYRSQWTHWTMVLMGGLSMSTALQSAFGVEEIGFTAARIGVIGLTLFPALIAYTHWIGERLVVTR